MNLEQYLLARFHLTFAQDNLEKATRLRQWWSFDLTAAVALIIFGAMIQEILVIYSSWGFLLSWNISFRRHKSLVTAAETSINHANQLRKE